MQNGVEAFGLFLARDAQAPDGGRELEQDPGRHCGPGADRDDADELRVIWPPIVTFSA